MFPSPFLATARSSLTHASNLEEIILFYGEITKFPLSLELVKKASTQEHLPL